MRVNPLAAADDAGARFRASWELLKEGRQTKRGFVKGIVSVCSPHATCRVWRFHRETGGQGGEREGLPFFSDLAPRRALRKREALASPHFVQVAASRALHVSFGRKISVPAGSLFARTDRSPSSIPRPSGGREWLTSLLNSVRPPVCSSHEHVCEAYDGRCHHACGACRFSIRDVQPTRPQVPLRNNLPGREGGSHFRAKRPRRFVRGDGGQGRNGSEGPPSGLPVPLSPCKSSCRHFAGRRAPRTTQPQHGDGNG